MTKAANKPVKNLVFNPSRRQFAAVGAAAALWSGNAGATTLAAAAKPTKAASLKVQNKGNLFHPETDEHPGLVMFASAAVSHSANAAVAHQLASQGWAVLLVDAPEHADPARVNREAQAHAEWLVAQPGVLKTQNATTTAGASKHSFVLRSFSAAHPVLSLASRTERRAANASGTLFAAPAAILAQSKNCLNSLHSAARSLHRLSA